MGTVKKLMLGNEAVARGLYEAGCALVSSYPGTPSTEITEYASKYDDIYCEWAPNEKVAMEVALGAAIAGKRAFCAMKHVGMNVAADPMFTASYTGVNAGMVIGVADDPGMHSSQNEQDSRHYAIAAKLPMVEPGDSAESKEYTKLAYELSETFDTPVILRMCTRISHSQSIVELKDTRENLQKPYEKNIAKYVMMPGFAKKRHVVVEQRMAALQEYAETTPLNRVEDYGSKIGVITSGTSYQYAKEVLGDTVNILKLGLIHPLPVKLILDFASKVEELIIIEELDPVIETHCKALGLSVIGKDKFPVIDEFSQNLVAQKLGLELPVYREFGEAVPVRPPVMCAGCPHRGLFYTLKKQNLTVSGDIGCYTLGSQAPLSSIDMCICMGASISGLHGFNKALGQEEEKRTVAVIGDSTFIHSGVTGLIDIAYNQTNSTVIILDNSITGMTGHQQNPTTGYNIKGDPAGKIDLESLCKAVGIRRVRVIDPYHIKECEAAVKEELAAEEPSVLISRRPCVLLKQVEKKPSLKVVTEKCRGCKSCMKIGCPAISMKEGKAVVDSTLCVGCDLCRSMCAFDAFVSTAE